MDNRDDYIIQKIVQYCSEIAKAHEVFENNKNLFVHPEDGAVYRNSVTMPLLQNIKEGVKSGMKTFLPITRLNIGSDRDMFHVIEINGVYNTNS